MKEIEHVIEAIIRQMGEFIDIAKSEKYQVLNKIKQFHVI